MAICTKESKRPRPNFFYANKYMILALLLPREDVFSAKVELHEALKAQEIHWKQRSRVKWLNEGDQNTKFLNQKGKARGSINKINHISINGSRTEDPTLIQAQAVNYFSNLFNPHQGQLNTLLFQIDSPMVTDSQNSFLISTTSELEVKTAIFFLKKNSSPGPDGFNVGFFTAT